MFQLIPSCVPVCPQCPLKSLTVLCIGTAGRQGRYGHSVSRRLQSTVYTVHSTRSHLAVYTPTSDRYFSCMDRRMQLDFVFPFGSTLKVFTRDVILMICSSPRQKSLHHRVHHMSLLLKSPPRLLKPVASSDCHLLDRIQGFLVWGLNSD